MKVARGKRSRFSVYLTSFLVLISSVVFQISTVQSANAAGSISINADNCSTPTTTSISCTFTATNTDNYFLVGSRTSFTSSTQYSSISGKLTGTAVKGAASTTKTVTLTGLTANTSYYIAIFKN